MKTYKPMVGDHISGAAKQAIELSNDGESVVFNFNDLEIIVNQGDTVESVCLQYDTKSNKRRIEYEKSDEYKKYQDEAVERLRIDQRLIDEYMLKLDKCKTHDEILDWFYITIPLIDHVGVNVDRQIIKDYLITLGYEENGYTDQPKEFYKDKNNFAHYIVGQIMNCWHPCIMRFIEDYRKL
jgi:hypothetical protein